MLRHQWIALGMAVSFPAVAFAGTSVQDAKVFRMRNRFGNAERKVEFKSYSSIDTMSYTYGCTFRSARLDDFSSDGLQLAYRPEGQSLRSRLPSFSALIERGVFHPDDNVGFQREATPGEIQELEIFRMEKETRALVVERVLVSAPHTLSEKGQQQWHAYQQIYEQAVSFHDAQPGNERFQGLVTGYTVCETRDGVEEYNLEVTKGVRYVKGSVTFVAGVVRRGTLQAPTSINGVVYEGEITFHQNSLVQRGYLRGEQIVNGLPLKGTINYYESGRIMDATLASRAIVDGLPITGGVMFFEARSKAGELKYGLRACNLTEPSRIDGRLYSGVVAFHAPNGIVERGTLAEPAVINGLSYKGDISFYDSGLVAVGNLTEITDVNGLPAKLVRFNVDGTLWMLQLGRPAEVSNGARFDADTLLTYDPKTHALRFGKILRSKLAVTEDQRCEFISNWEGQSKVSIEAAFQANGRVESAILVGDCVLPFKGKSGRYRFESGDWIQIDSYGVVQQYKTYK